MKAILINWRYYILWTLALVALLGIFSTPADDASAAQLIIGIVASKAMGITAACLWYRLYTRWAVSGAIPELVNIVKEEN